MKNHWTDKKALNDFIRIVSEKVGQILNTDPANVRQAMLDDIKDCPLDADEIRMLRDTQITDEVIAKMIDMMPDDVMDQLLNRQSAGCGLW